MNYARNWARKQSVHCGGNRGQVSFPFENSRPRGKNSQNGNSRDSVFFGKLTKFISNHDTHGGRLSSQLSGGGFGWNRSLKLIPRYRQTQVSVHLYSKESQNLISISIEPSVHGLNVTVPEDAKAVIKPWDEREDNSRFVDSNVDDQV